MSARKLLVFTSLAGLLAASGIVYMSRRQPQGPRPSAGPPQDPSGEVTIAYPQDPVSLDPYSVQGDTSATKDLLRPVLPTLLTITPEMRYAPGLALRVPRGRDITTTPFSVTYHLDPAARWSDGSAMGAADVRATWQAIRQGTVASSRYSHVVDVKVDGPHRVTVVFDTPQEGWRDLFSAGDFILPASLAGRGDRAEVMSTGAPISGGPFLLQAYEAGLSLTYSSNPKWWRNGPGLKRVTVLIVPDDETAIGLFKQDEVDVIAATSRLNLRHRLSAAGASVSARFGYSWWELVFNTSSGDVREPHLRRAIALSVDRQGFVEAFLSSEGRVLDSQVPGSGPKLYADLHRDNKAASAELKLAKVPASTGRSTLTISAAVDSLGDLLERTIERALTDLGLKVDLRDTSADELYGEWLPKGDFQIALVERRGSPALSAISADSAALRSQLTVLPLLETQMIIGFRRNVKGPSANASTDGPLWNLHMWKG
ncbi:MAG TPA: ABC transporter substrate-binding protein [Actinomycetota bacterium]|nr:ABC transporter substrate-binding protein [Actinomycetota bacterium]